MSIYIPEDDPQERIETLSEFKYVNCKNAILYEGWNFNSGNYLFTTDTK